jgi:hypothetical protein
MYMSVVIQLKYITNRERENSVKKKKYNYQQILKT